MHVRFLEKKWSFLTKHCFGPNPNWMRLLVCCVPGCEIFGFHSGSLRRVRTNRWFQVYVRYLKRLCISQPLLLSFELEARRTLSPFKARYGPNNDNPTQLRSCSLQVSLTLSDSDMSEWPSLLTVRQSADLYTPKTKFITKCHFSALNFNTQTEFKQLRGTNNL